MHPSTAFISPSFITTKIKAIPMVSSPSSSQVLRSPPSANPSKSLTRQLSPILERIRYRRSLQLTIASASSSSTCTSPKETRSPTPIVANSLYEVLGIPIGASSDEIKAAYRRLARICHPDVVASSERRGLLTSGTTGDDEFIRIYSAYSTLSDPEKRADYDRKLFRRRLQPLGSSLDDLSSSQTSSYCAYPRRNWETDQCW